MRRWHDQILVFAVIVGLMVGIATELKGGNTAKGLTRFVPIVVWLAHSMSMFTAWLLPHEVEEDQANMDECEEKRPTLEELA